MMMAGKAPNLIQSGTEPVDKLLGGLTSGRLYLVHGDAAGKSLFARLPIDASQLDEVILGCAAPSVDEVNIGRIAALRMGCGLKVPAWTVMRNCASGMQSIDSAIANMVSERSHLVLAGGVDALSRAPLLYNDAMVNWFSDFAAARGQGAKFDIAMRRR